MQKNKMRIKEAANLLGVNSTYLTEIIRDNADTIKVKKVSGAYWLDEQTFLKLEVVVKRSLIIKNRKREFVGENMQDILDDSKRDVVALKYAKVFGVQEWTAKSKLNKIAYEEKLKLWRQNDTRTNFRQECEND
jgi:hypothetical protein